MHQSSYNKMKMFADQLRSNQPGIPLTIVDLGSKDINGSYKPLFDYPNWSYVGVDMDSGPNVDYVLTDPYDWEKIESASVDVVVSGQTFEHAEYIWLSILEIERVLKPFGLVCLIAPATGYEHRYPTDCWRFYPDGFTALAKFAKLQPLVVNTEWSSPVGTYSDGSEHWSDSILIAKKDRETEDTSLAIVRDTLRRHIKTL